ncbi:MAG: ribosome assembly RNA-binding protein YhbY [Fibrobacterota bacterium]|nr:ribosome assembly RNA-binding protein YhbY [Chitinispirillaceae bacterium]
MSLTPKQRQYLKGLGHALNPILQIGKEGLNERQLASLSKALEDHELIKVNILENADLTKNDVSETILKALNAETVQTIGRKILLYKKSKEKSKIVLP